VKDLQNEAEFEPGDVEHARAEQFVDSILPRDRVLRVLDIKAGVQRFEIRKPAYVVGVDVLQAERGRRPDADEHRVMDLEQVEIESAEYDVVLCINVLEHARDPLRPSSLLAHARSGGWNVQYFRTYEGPVQKSVRHRIGIVGWRWRLVAGLTRAMTLGLLTAEDTGIIAILTKIP
jgi:hypothetical protein